jgi:hypothetical protein
MTDLRNADGSCAGTKPSCLFFYPGNWGLYHTVLTWIKSKASFRIERDPPDEAAFVQGAQRLAILSLFARLVRGVRMPLKTRSILGEEG